MHPSLTRLSAPFALTAIVVVSACDTDAIRPPLPPATSSSLAALDLALANVEEGDGTVVSGPFTVQRNRGKPRLDMFGLHLDAPAGEYVLRVINGDGDPNKHATGGLVWVNGVLVFDIEEQGAFTELDLALGSVSLTTLGVRLTGKPGTKLGLSVLEVGGGGPPSAPGYVATYAGHNHTCALDTDGRAWCWGQAADGSVGDGGGNTWQTTPVQVVGDLAFSSLTTGFGYTCGVTTDMNAYCWGRNEYGQLGDGTTDSRFAPVPVSGGHLFTAIDAGLTQTCGLTPAGGAWCWGQNLNGGIGNGTTQSSSPVQVTGGLSFSQISVGWEHACGVVPSGLAYCWGAGAFGNGISVWTVTGTPVQAATASSLSFATVTAGGSHTCGITVSQEAFCWGQHNQGAIGDGSYSYAWTPVAVAGGHTFRTIDAGASNTCAVTSSDEAYCWGANDQGQLGIGTFTYAERTPQAISFPGPVASITSGNVTACATLADGSAYCWGNNDAYQSGTGVLGDNSVPVPVAPPIG